MSKITQAVTQQNSKIKTDHYRTTVLKVNTGEGLHFVGALQQYDRRGLINCFKTAMYCRHAGTYARVNL